MEVSVRQNEEERKFYAHVEGHEAVVEYAKMGDVYNLAHTYVPEEVRGKGVAGQLVRGTLDEIKRQGARFLPSCPFVQAFVKKHPEYEEGVARYDE